MEKTTENSDNVTENPKKKPSKKTKKEENLYAEDALALAGLSFKEKISYKRQLFKKRISTMKTKDKILYTIRYYKWYFVSLAVIVICLCWVGRAIYRSTFPTLLNVAVLNEAFNDTVQDYIPEAFREYYQLDNKNYIKVYTDLFVSSTEDTTEVGTTMTDYQKLGFYNMSDMLDAIIGDEEALTLYASSDDTTAIDLSMDADLYSKIEDRVITMSDPSGVKNNGKPYTAAIDISGTDFVKNCNISYDKVYLMIPSTKYTDNQGTIDLIKLIFGL